VTDLDGEPDIVAVDEAAAERARVRPRRAAGIGRAEQAQRTARAPFDERGATRDELGAQPRAARCERCGVDGRADDGWREQDAPPLPSRADPGRGVVAAAPRRRRTGREPTP
jgi:hypothetical protein